MLLINRLVTHKMFCRVYLLFVSLIFISAYPADQEKNNHNITKNVTAAPSINKETPNITIIEITESDNVQTTTGTSLKGDDQNEMESNEVMCEDESYDDVIEESDVGNVGNESVSRFGDPNIVFKMYSNKIELIEYDDYFFYPEVVKICLKISSKYGFDLKAFTKLSEDNTQYMCQELTRELSDKTKEVIVARCFDIG